jgi:hypothetical protein
MNNWFENRTLRIEKKLQKKLKKKKFSNGMEGICLR